MTTYLVGGAVRDKLLGLDIQDQDWLVLNETADSLIDKGYLSVGQDFQVFLHPKTKEEYSLLRNQAKTIEDDLEARDLTINAMALAKDGTIIDPLNGQQDLVDRILRHTPYFEQDPIRILRLCRFYAKFKYLNFKIAPETIHLIKKMRHNGKIQALKPERVWQELVKAMALEQPWFFFEGLRQTGALVAIFPEIEALYGKVQPITHHPEIDTGLHCMMVLEQICKKTADPKVRLAALFHDLGKATTATNLLPSHHGHEQRGALIVKKLYERLNAPKKWQQLAFIVAKYHTYCHRIMELKATSAVKKFTEMGLFRFPELLDPFLLCCHADSQGRTGFESRPYPQTTLFKQYFEAAANIDLSDIENYPPAQIPTEIYQRRVHAVKEIIKTL